MQLLKHKKKYMYNWKDTLSLHCSHIYFGHIGFPLIVWIIPSEWQALISEMQNLCKVFKWSQPVLNRLEKYIALQLMSDNNNENQIYTNDLFSMTVLMGMNIYQKKSKRSDFSHHILSLMKLILEQYWRKRLHNEGVF